MSNQPVPFCSQKIGSLVVGEGYSHQGGLRLQCLDEAGNYSSIPGFFHEHMDTWLSIFPLSLMLARDVKKIHELGWLDMARKQGSSCVFTSIVHHGWWKVLDAGGSGGQTGEAKEECVHSSGPVGKKLRQFAQAWTKALRYLWQLGIPFPNDRHVKCLKNSSSKCSRFWK